MWMDGWKIGKRLRGLYETAFAPSSIWRLHAGPPCLSRTPPRTSCGFAAWSWSRSPLLTWPVYIFTFDRSSPSLFSTFTMSLPTRKIGNDEVTAIGWGAMGISAFYGSVESDEERLKVRALNARI
jgi:hypothetical protein